MTVEKIILQIGNCGCSVGGATDGIALNLLILKVKEKYVTFIFVTILYK